MIQTFRGFHGTRADLVPSIVQSGLRPSREQDDWLGHGSYFFVEGLESPWESARDWARVDVWDKRFRRYRRADFAVIEYEIAVQEDAVWDLRTAEDAREFHRARDRWLERRLHLRRPGLRRPSRKTYDTDLLNFFKQENGIAAIISDFYIQLSVKERWFRHDSRIPNVSVLCVSHPVVSPTRIDVVEIHHVPFEAITHLEGML